MQSERPKEEQDVTFDLSVTEHCPSEIQDRLVAPTRSTNRLVIQDESWGLGAYHLTDTWSHYEESPRLEQHEAAYVRQEVQKEK